jgi:hypothetical protein
MPLDDMTKTRIVFMILDKRTEEALQLLSTFYNTTPPRMAVGTIKGRRKTVYAVYLQKEGKIYATNSDILYNPFIMLHEFYHHLRTKAGVHRGTERNANMYAKSFIDAYNRTISKLV